MLGNIFVNENTKNFKRSMLWVEVGVMAVLVLLIHLVIFATIEMNLGGESPTAEAQAQMRQSLVWPTALPGTISFAGGNALGGMLLIILVGAATAQEYNWRTLHLWLSRGVPRPVLLAGKFAALVIPALLFVLAALFAGGAITAFFTLQFDGGLPLDQIDNLQVLLSVLRSAYALLPYAALAFLLAIAFRSTVVAVGGGLAFSLLGEGVALQLLTLAGGSLQNIANLLPSGLGNSLTSLNVAMIDTGLASGQASSTGLAPIPAATGIALWTLIFFGLALIMFQRQDIAD